MVHARRGVDHHPLALKVDPVAAGGQTLHLIQIGFVARIAVEFMPGVNQRQGIAIDHRRAGEAAVFILRPSGASATGRCSQCTRSLLRACPQCIGPHWVEYG
jgi:hypothetical protein